MRPLLQANIPTYKLPVDISNCWKSDHPVVKAKQFPKKPMIPIQSFPNEFQNMRGKWGNTVSSCDNSLDDVFIALHLSTTTLGPFTPT